MRIKKATKKYEAWLAKNITIVPADLALKHTRMAEDMFQFLRAAFYRWLQVWQQACPDLARAPRVLAVVKMAGDTDVAIARRVPSFRITASNSTWALFSELKSPFKIASVLLVFDAGITLDTVPVNSLPAGTTMRSKA